jgi:hypothetical protein
MSEKKRREGGWVVIEILNVLFLVEFAYFCSFPVLFIILFSMRPTMHARSLALSRVHCLVYSQIPAFYYLCNF